MCKGLILCACFILRDFALSLHLRLIRNIMASKLWEKTVQVNHDVETYTVGRDREMDM